MPETFMTLDQLADDISGDRPRWQRDANLTFLIQTHRTLKEDGVWIFPGQMRVFRKRGDGFIEVEI